MIEILGPVLAAAHGGCVECDPNDDRGDDLYVFQLGSFKIRLCRQHLAMLQACIARSLDADPSSARKQTTTRSIESSMEAKLASR